MKLEVAKANAAEPAESRPPLRLAVLGGGAVVSQFYWPAVAPLREVEFRLVVEPSAGARANLRAAGYDGPMDERSFELVLETLDLAEDGCQAALVALPNHLHEAAVLAALGRNLHVLCEKPLSLSVAACRRMADAARAQRRVLAVGMVRRLLPSVAALRRALELGLVGRVESVEVTDGAPFQWNSDSGSFFCPENGGVFADIGVHYLDLLFDLFGPMEPVAYEDDWRGGCEANASCTLQAQTGVAIRIMLSRDRELSNRICVQGETGRLIIDKHEPGACIWLDGADGLRGRLQAPTPARHPDWPACQHACFARQFLEFAAAVRRETGPRVDAEAAAETIRIIEWAYGRRRLAAAWREDAAPDAAAPPELPPGRVVVTGGTGFIGSRLVERLAEQGCDSIVVPVRNHRTCTEVARHAVALPRVNLLDPAEVAQACRDARFVFHLAYGRDGADGHRVTVEGTRNVLRGAMAAGAEAVVVVSTISVFGQPKTPEPVDETWPSRPATAYGRAKSRMEQMCLQLANGARHTRCVLLNPSCVYGEFGQTYTQLPIALARQGSFCWIDGGRGTANYSYVGNVVDALLLAARCSSAHAQRFIITDGTCTWREFLEPLLGPLAVGLPELTQAELSVWQRKHRPGLRDLGRAILAAPAVMHVLRRMWGVGAAKKVVQAYFPGLRSSSAPSWLPRPARSPGLVDPPIWLAELFGPSPTQFSAARARKVLGWQPRVNRAVGQARTIAWLRAMGLRQDPEAAPGFPGDLDNARHMDSWISQPRA